MPLNDLLRPLPTRCRPSDSVDTVAERMRRHQVDEILVLDAEARLLGVVAANDVKASAARGAESGARHTIVSCMTAPALWLRDDASLDELQLLMRQQRLQRVPISDANDVIIGTVSAADIDHSRARLPDTEGTTMPERSPDPMRAAVLEAPGQFAIHPAPLPIPGPGQVRVRLAGSGVCASNIPAFEGREWFNYPLPPGELGHEGWGSIDALGAGVTGLQPGDRVAALSFKAYAEYDLAQADQVVRLPDELAGQPFPGEALGCAMNIFRRAQISAGQTVVVVGVGFLGGALIQLARDAGARVIGISRSSTSLELARECGADETVVMDDHARIIEEVSRLTGGRFCERVIEATGKPWPLDLAGELTGMGGTLVIAGYHQDGLRQVNVQLWNWRGIDVINAHERDPHVAVEGMRRAVHAVVEGRLRLAPLLTHRFALADLTQALEAARSRPEGFTKAVVLMEAGRE